MLFSELFGIRDRETDDWFDPLLSVDTRLFMDPFLLYAYETGEFHGSHDEIISFFNSVFQIVAQSGGDSRSSRWKKAKGLLYFPEVDELCLGYTSVGTRGSGSGGEISHQVALALWNAVELGITEIRHFEEIQIFQTNIGADRISDASANILRHRLAAYTRRICQEHHVPTRPIDYRYGQFDPASERWSPIECNLPMNPYSNRPILLIPSKYLRSLPTINADDFWDFCFSNENESLRREFSEDISRNVDKATIISFARRHPEVRERYVRQKESEGSSGYDFARDPSNMMEWYRTGRRWSADNPIRASIQSSQELITFIERMIEQFCNFVQNNAGWQQLWSDDGRPRPESIAQNLFLAVVKGFCIENDVDISKEPNIGRGPVDFKVSRGYEARSLIEVKLAKNTKFWHGLQRQLPKYLEAESVNIGYFLVICFNDKDFERISDINQRVRVLNDELPYEIKVEIVDATQGPPSASQL